MRILIRSQEPNYFTLSILGYVYTSIGNLHMAKAIQRQFRVSTGE